MAKISVIVPVYQAAGYLKKCVESIERQTERDIEILLVDDGSTDGSSEFCDALANKDSRIRVFHTENRGAAAARNFGVKQSKGKYIAFIDSDDFVHPGYLEYLLKIKTEGKASIAVCAHRKLWQEEEPEEEATDNLTKGSKLLYYPELSSVKALLYQENFMSVPWGMLSDRQLWDKVQFPEGTEAEDMGTIYRLFLEAEAVVYGDREYYYYVQRLSSTVYATSVSRMRACYKHSREMVSYIRKNVPSCYIAAVSRHFSCCAQVLSETSMMRWNTAFVKRLYKDMKALAPTVAKDRDARRINRVAARIAGISVTLLHVMLRIYYRTVLQRMK